MEEERIACDFERKENYVYAQSNQEVASIKAGGRSGAPRRTARLARTRVPLPFWVAAAVRLENQAQFHPRKYLLALAETIPGDGSHVFELTTAPT